MYSVPFWNDHHFSCLQSFLHLSMSHRPSTQIRESLRMAIRYCEYQFSSRKFCAPRQQQNRIDLFVTDTKIGIQWGRYPEIDIREIENQVRLFQQDQSYLNKKCFGLKFAGMCQWVLNNDQIEVIDSQRRMTIWIKCLRTCRWSVSWTWNRHWRPESRILCW
jgi:hypothetical protein